jgi:hypothetical protein
MSQHPRLAYPVSQTMLPLWTALYMARLESCTTIHFSTSLKELAPPFPAYTLLDTFLSLPSLHYCWCCKIAHCSLPFTRPLNAAARISRLFLLAEHARNSSKGFVGEGERHVATSPDGVLSICSAFTCTFLAGYRGNLAHDCLSPTHLFSSARENAKANNYTGTTWRFPISPPGPLPST